MSVKVALFYSRQVLVRSQYWYETAGNGQTFLHLMKSGACELTYLTTFSVPVRFPASQLQEVPQIMNTTYPAEQKTLLLITHRHAEPLPPRSTTRTNAILESCALALILFLAASHCLLLYGIHSIPSIALSESTCLFLSDLAAGLRLSIPASLPTATLLFIASPWAARRERVLVMWYVIALGYLVGSTVGALLLMRV